MKKFIFMLLALLATGIASAQTDEQKKTDSINAIQKPPVNPTEAYTEGRVPDSTGSTTRIGVKKSAIEKVNNENNPAATDRKPRRKAKK